MHLYLSTCRNLYTADGRFETGNLQDWQHSAMYAAFLVSGLVDLIGFYAPAGTLPPGTEHVRAHAPACCPHVLFRCAAKAVQESGT